MSDFKLRISVKDNHLKAEVEQQHEKAPKATAKDLGINWTDFLHELDQRKGVAWKITVRTEYDAGQKIKIIELDLTK